MGIEKTDILFYLVISFFSVYIILQIYIVLRMRTIIQKLFDILIRVNALMKHINPPSIKVASKQIRTCKNCKNRVPFYFSDPEYESYFYYRCRLTRKQVPPEYTCEHFIMDPQTYDV